MKVRVRQRRVRGKEGKERERCMPVQSKQPINFSWTKEK